MICMKSGQKNDKNDMIVIFVVIPLIIIIIVVVVIIVVMILKKRTNGDYVEMDEDIYDVDMGGRKKGRLEISSTLE